MKTKESIAVSLIVKRMKESGFISSDLSIRSHLSKLIHYKKQKTFHNIFAYCLILFESKEAFNIEN